LTINGTEQKQTTNSGTLGKRTNINRKRGINIETRGLIELKENQS